MKVKKRPRTFMVTRLTWMWENQPEYLLELYREHQLGSNLYDKVQEAKELEQMYESLDMDEDLIEELILDYLAPAQEPKENNPITEKQFNQILKKVLPLQ